MVLGAQAEDLKKMVLGQSLILLGIGVTIGLFLVFRLTTLDDGTAAGRRGPPRLPGAVPTSREG